MSKIAPIIAQQLFPSPVFGSAGGGNFDDIVEQSPSQIVQIQSVTIRWGLFVDSIQTTYLLDNGDVWTSDNHGGDGGSPTVISLDVESGERVVAIYGRYGNVVDNLALVTEKFVDGKLSRSTYGPYGRSNGGQPFHFDGDIYGFFGGAGEYLNRIGVYIGQQTLGLLLGGTGGAFFCDPVLANCDMNSTDPNIVNPITGLYQINVNHGEYVNSIITGYWREKGDISFYGPNGGSSGTWDIIILDEGEKIFATIVRSGRFVDSLAFLSLLKDGTRKTYGPYGGTGGSQTIINATLRGFMGRCGNQLDAVGFFLENPPTPQISVFGANGYRYCALEGDSGTFVSNLPVTEDNCSVSFQLRIDDSDNPATMVVTAPDGTVYRSASNGVNGVWATPSAGASSGLLTFFISVARTGNWKAEVVQADPNRNQWSVISVCTPGADASNAANYAFQQLPESERGDLTRAIYLAPVTMPMEFCFICQAHMLAIMGLAITAFYFWDGGVTPTSMLVLYARKYFPQTDAEEWVTRFETAYSLFTHGLTALKIARWLCEQQGMCLVQDEALPLLSPQR